MRLAALSLLAILLAACAAEEPAALDPPVADDLIAEAPADEEAGANDEAESIPIPEQCDAEDYRPLIGTPAAAATFPQNEFFRAYGETDIITQEYLPRRTNVVYGSDGIIKDVFCG